MALTATISGGSVQPMADSTGAIARAGFPPGGNTMYFGGDSFYYHPPEGTPGYDGKGWEFQDQQLLEAVKKKEEEKKKKTEPPPPTGPNPNPPEIIHDRDDAIAVCTSPDVCKTLSAPVPYMVFGKGGDDRNYAGTVRSNGLIVKKNDSKFTRTYGDQPGRGLGVKSGTVEDVVEPVTHSPVVRVEGEWVIRHHDKCTLNKGNCPGEYIHVKSTATHEPPDGNDEDDKRGGWQKFKDQFMDKSETAQDVKGLWDKAGEYWDDPSKIGSDLQGAYDSLPSGAEIWQGAQDIGSGIVDGAADIWNDPGAAASSAGSWISDQASGAWQGTKDVWNKDGAAGLAGAALGVAADIVSPSKKAKMAGRALEAADDLGDAAKAKKLADARKAKEDGKPGVRSTRLFEVKCFKKPKGMSDKEFDRQLKEQEDAINNTTADKMAERRQAIKDAGGTGPLRDAGAQQAARDAYRNRRLAELADEGVLGAAAQSQVANELAGLAATHRLDIIAGGDPGDISGMGDRSVNSSLGSQWKGERSQSLENEAKKMQKEGRGKEKMKVKLKRCK